MFSRAVKRFACVLMVLLMPPVSMASGKSEPFDLLSLLKKNFGENVLPLKASKKPLVKWHITNSRRARGFEKRHPGAKWVYGSARINVRSNYAVEEIAFFWVSKKYPSVLYRVKRRPGLTPAPRFQVIEFNAPESQCDSPYLLVMGVRVKEAWYYDTRKIGYIITGCENAQ